MADELRDEIDTLRLENQALHARLAEYRRPAYALRKAIGTAWHRVQQRLRRPRAVIADPNTPEVEPYRVRVPAAHQTHRPRILHAIGNFHRGGSSQLVVDLLERLGDRFEQSVLTRDLPSRPAYVGFPIQERREFNSSSQALVALRTARPDLLHVHYLGHHRDRDAEKDWQWYHRIFQAAERYGCPVVENVNVPVGPYLSSAVGTYVFVSDWVRERFAHARARNITIHPGSDLSLFVRRNGPPPDDCIGMVYRLEGDKLDERAIDVFIEVARRRPGTRALIVGGGRFLDAYQSRVRAAGASDAVRFTGYVPYHELPSFYEQMSLFVAPVHRESFGQVSPFAMGMSLPVVGYDVGALRELTGDPGLLAPPGDVEALVRIIIDLLDDRPRRLDIGARNRGRAEVAFSIEAMIEQYAGLYQRLMEPR